MEKTENNLLNIIEYPELYNSEYILVYDTFNIELRKLLEKSGNIEDFISKYNKCLRFLENLQRTCVESSNNFEELKNTTGLYSMKIKNKQNIRIIFFFDSIKSKEKVILLNCFMEKSKKDYIKNIAIAQSRRTEILELD